MTVLDALSRRPRPARPLARAATTLALAAGAVVASGLAATAAPDQTSGREITRYDVAAVLGADGVATVAIEFDFDFGDDPGHGPYLTLPTRQRYDDTHDRAFEYSAVSVSSSTGAPAQLHREEDGDALILRIGDEDVDDVSGVQTYQLTYRVDGLVNPANEQHSGDELYWNVIGTGWEIPLGDLTATVTGPADVEGAVCFAGPQGSTSPCSSADAVGDTATFTQDLLGQGEPFTTVTGWPAGTFPGVEPIVVERPDPAAVWNPVSPLGGVAALMAAGGAALAIRRVRRTGRDRAYLGLTPGLRPVSGQDTGSGYRDKRAPVAVQFTPPANVRPGELGTLVDEKADPVDVTATLIDLAVRGYLRIEEVPRADAKKKPKDWTLVALREPDAGLLEYEALLMDEIFTGRPRVTLSDLKTTFASSMTKVQDRLYDQVTRNHWFRANPKSVRGSWLATGIVLIVVAGIALFVSLAVGDSELSTNVPGLGLIPIAIGAVGVVVLICARHAPARTEEGTAVLAQSLGFRTYLTTAEAEQIRFEEGEDVFSRYLPYAIVFGVAERWARVFAELAAQGRAIDPPGWYVGYYDPLPGVFWASGFASSMDRFQSVATESLTAPTPGSSGDSGFSGGFSGGGVGGGGGGGW
ncbi:DUF2207 domain-containing protein [Cellulomonas persica]|uniref:DUF2207 domain-containing protein n=1 Tax=Cellulomonas persica TaxID=76861 RepID=A0A510UPD0_9CELL|nr:DUF2207 domain-containing protein [Cellulomonas persica]GEK16514.1 hypothetical protein CPE01_02470 [Cellulomonas persica]